MVGFFLVGWFGLLFTNYIYLTYVYSILNFARHLLVLEREGYNGVVRRGCKYKRENWEKAGRGIKETKEG